MRYDLGAHLDIGVGRKLQEDYVRFQEFGGDLLAVVADGTGTTDDYLQPAVLAVNNILKDVSLMVEKHSVLFNQDPLFFLEQAMLNANRMIGMLKLANEERYSGYMASVSTLFLTEKGEFYYAHAGNTRIYLLRANNLLQLTEDHTVGMQKIAEGVMQESLYYTHEDRLKLTSGIGFADQPQIYLNQGKIKNNDILIMTSDGIHYALLPDVMVRTILESESVVNAAENLVYLAVNEVHYPDNMAAVIIGATEPV